MKPSARLDFERAAWLAGHRRVAGIDEAGRGPLAGPVVAAAVLFDPDLVGAQADSLWRGLTDSKQLSPAQRDHFYEALTRQADVRWAVAVVEASDIDRLNILQATHRAMCEACSLLLPEVDYLLVDGLPVPRLPVPSEALVKGDARSLSIAAASVLAKVTRDRILCDLDLRYPGYGFARHKGYGTPEHLAALQRLGPSACHRRSFAPVRQLALNFPAAETS